MINNSSDIWCKVSYSVPIEVKNKSEGNLLQNCAVAVSYTHLEYELPESEVKRGSVCEASGWVNHHWVSNKTVYMRTESTALSALSKHAVLLSFWRLLLLVFQQG